MGLATARWGGRTLVVAAALFLAGSLRASLWPTRTSGSWSARFIQGLGAGAGMPVGHSADHPPREARVPPPGLRPVRRGHGLGTVGTLLVMPSIAGRRRVPRRLRRCSRSSPWRSRGVAVALEPAMRSRPESGAMRSCARCWVRWASAARKRLGVLLDGPDEPDRGRPWWSACSRGRREFLHDQLGTWLAVAAYLTAAIGLSQAVGNPSGASAMTRVGQERGAGRGSRTHDRRSQLLIPAGPGIGRRRSSRCVATTFLAGAVLLPASRSSPMSCTGMRPMGAATGLIGLLNVSGSMIAPWVFGALLDTVRHGAGRLWLHGGVRDARRLRCSRASGAPWRTSFCVGASAARG